MDEEEICCDWIETRHFGYVGTRTEHDNVRDVFCLLLAKTSHMVLKKIEKKRIEKLQKLVKILVRSNKKDTHSLKTTFSLHPP